MLDVGDRNGRLVIISKEKNEKGTWYVCKCDCSKYKKIHIANIKRTLSCGCLRKELAAQKNFKHGKYKDRVHKIWSDMHQRCKNPNATGYKNYGGRGINVCSEWDDFEQFYKDMGDPPKGATLEREDNSKGYSPDNCKWANWTEQCNNRRTNKYYKYKGELLTLAEIARKENIGIKTLDSRIRLYGFTLEEALDKERFAPKLYDFRGKKLRLKEIAKEVDIKYPTLYKRVVLKGMSLDEALSK